MNDHTINESPTSTWGFAEYKERFDVRIHVRSAISTLPQSLGPENVKETYNLSDQRVEAMEKPEVTEYSVDGEVAVSEDRITLIYPEPAMTGLGKCETRITYFPSDPDLLELNRTGASAVHCVFDLKSPRQNVTFQTLFGAFEPILTLKGLINLLDYGIGKLLLDYTVDFPNIFTEHIELLINVRRLRPNESKSKATAPRPNEELLRQISSDMDKVSRFDYDPKQEDGDQT